MHHKFDAKSSTKLDNEERRKRLPPDKVLHKFGLAQGDTVADVGCGIGYFTIPASNIVGPDGRVFAMDISEEMLANTREKAHQARANNIETIKISENDFLLPANSVNIGIIFFVLHEAQEPCRFLSELHRIIKPGGRLAMIDWEKREMPQGPPAAHRISNEEATLLLEQTGFSVTVVDIDENFYGLLGIKRL